MVKMKLKAALAVLGTTVPFFVQADMNNTDQTNKPAPVFNQGEPVKENMMQGERDGKNQLPAAYNQAACWSTTDSFDMYISGSFLYWTAVEADMRVATQVNAAGTGYTELFQTGGYKPAFKVGLGFDLRGMDHWNFVSEYTWYNSTNTMSASAGSGFLTPGFGDHFIHGTVPAVEASSVSNKWKLAVNILDAGLQRPFYSGRKLTANFGAGLRALWISQSTSTTFSGTVIDDTLVGTVSIYDQDKMWALGPRVAFDGNWLFGMGFRFTGRFANSLLFASYTTLGGHSNINDAVETHTYNTNGNYNNVRAVTEAGLGLGWETYCCDDSFHFDLFAGYDFNAFWNQNLLNLTTEQDGDPGSLYLHGLTVTARFDF